MASLEEINSALSRLQDAPALSTSSLASAVLHTSVNTTPSSPHPGPQPALLPSDLRAELAHNKDHFSKLRFNYVEQVTKERLLKAIATTDSPTPPPSSSAASIAALEAKLADDKAALKVRKEAVASLLQRLDGKARALAAEQGRVGADVAALVGVAGEGRLAELQERVREAREAERERGGEGGELDPRMRMGLAETLAAVERAEGEERMEERREAEVRAALERGGAEVLRLKGELGLLEERKRAAVAEAVEARKRVGRDGAMDAVEARGRWARAAAVVLEGIAA